MRVESRKVKLLSAIRATLDQDDKRVLFVGKLQKDIRIPSAGTGRVKIKYLTAVIPDRN